jgi:hypothetical protein
MPFALSIRAFSVLIRDVLNFWSDNFTTSVNSGSDVFSVSSSSFSFYVLLYLIFFLGDKT